MLRGEIDGAVPASAVGGYVGHRIDIEGGTIFFGTGFQRGRSHFMVSCSGEASHNLASHVLSDERLHNCACSRMDVQATVIPPDDWSQKNLRNRLEKNGKTVGFPTPKGETIEGRKLETVYVGQRSKSDRFYRIYMKEAEGVDYVLRFEVELKKRRSRAIWSHFTDNGRIFADVLLAEIQKMAQMDKKASALLAPVISGDARPLRVRSNEGDTMRWILLDVMPIIERLILSHGNRSALVDALYAALEKGEVSQL